MNQLTKTLIFLLLFISAAGVSSQEKFENTLKFNEDSVAPQALLEQVSWIQGHWKGEAFGGKTEEIWSAPDGESMMFVFRLIADGKIVFYEIGGIRQVGQTLLMQLKHFNGDFTGWEEKDQTVDFKLVKVEPDKVYFDQLTFERINDNEMNVYVVIGHDDGKQEEVKFNYKK